MSCRQRRDRRCSFAELHVGPVRDLAVGRDRRDGRARRSSTPRPPSLLAIDDDGFWYRHVVSRYGRRTAPRRRRSTRPGPAVPRDRRARPRGAAARDPRRQRADNGPLAARRAHIELTRWETDWSSQTGACQAGLLHGNNFDMPAFRWWEKERGAAIVTNHPRDAAELERRHSDGRGLLFSDGASRANIVSGDAPHSLLTMSTVLRRERHGRIGQDYFAYFANPYNVTRTIVLVAARGLQRAVERLTTAPAGHAARASTAASPTRSCARGRRSSSATCRSTRSSATCTPGDRSSTRRSWPTTRSPTTRGSSAPRRSRRCARSTARSGASPRPRERRRAPISSSCSPTTASPRARRSAIATAGRSRSS